MAAATKWYCRMCPGGRLLCGGPRHQALGRRRRLFIGVHADYRRVGLGATERQLTRRLAIKTHKTDSNVR